jgi:hypothetical protein
MALAARRANAGKSTGPRTGDGKLRAYQNLTTATRHFDRLLGLPEATILGQEVGAAVHLYYDLIAPYEPAPPLLAMHFRDLARLQLELQAWERIRDAQMAYRAERTALEMRRLRRDATLEVISPIAGPDGSVMSEQMRETGLAGLPDSFAKFDEQCACLAIVKALLKEQRYPELGPCVRRLYGEKLRPKHERGRVIASFCWRLMEEKEDLKMTEPEMDVLARLLDAEERDVLEAWEIALEDREVTRAAERARLAPTRDDHWMNRQGDRLRQAIDRKMRFTPVLLRSLGLAQRTRPAPCSNASKTQTKTSTSKAGMSHENNHLDKNVVAPKAGMSFRINKKRFSPKPETHSPRPDTSSRP